VIKAQSIGGAWVRSGKARADIDPCDTRDVVGDTSFLGHQEPDQARMQPGEQPFDGALVAGLRPGEDLAELSIVVRSR